MPEVANEIALNCLKFLVNAWACQNAPPHVPAQEISLQ